MLTENLTDTEKGIYKMLVDEALSYQDIAKKINKTIFTTKYHIQSILNKTGANNTKELIVLHYKGLLEREGIR